LIPVTGECDRNGNDYNLYAVAMKKQDLDQDRVIDHVLQTISTLCHFFLSRGGAISGTVIGVRRLPQGGLMFLVN